MRAHRLKGILALGLLAAWLPAQAQTVRYVHTDALGSPVAMTDANRVVVQTRQYEPYGKRLNGSNNDRPGYTGHVEDAATGLTYMQQRYYDPGIGRFLSVDPVTAYENPMGAFNRYWYTGNNPYTFTDPDGRQKTVAWLVKLSANGMRKVARLTREQAIRARRAGQNIHGDRRQVSSGVERAAHGGEGQLKHAGHELKDGSKGSPHYQTEGVPGHSFWGKLSVAAMAAASTLDQVAEAADYIPDAAPRPATQEDVDRTNGVINAINDAAGTAVPNFPDAPPPPQLPPPPPPDPEARLNQ